MKIKTIGTLLLESALIIFSVLVSFSIESWREQRSDHKKAREYLARIKKDLESDSLLLNEILQDHKYIQEKTMEYLYSYEKWNGGKTLPISNDSIAVTINSALKEYKPFEPVSSAYSSLKSNGQLDLIQNATLADKIISYYERNALHHHMQGYNNAIGNELWPYLIQNVDLFDAYAVDQKRYGQTKSDYAKLYAGNEFKSILYHLTGRSLRIVHWTSQDLDTIKKIKELIKKELSE
jgi:hypothetical protein